MESEISVSGFRFHGRAASSMKPKECMQSISLAIMVADTVLKESYRQAAASVNYSLHRGNGHAMIPATIQARTLAIGHAMTESLMKETAAVLEDNGVDTATGIIDDRSGIPGTARTPRLPEDVSGDRTAEVVAACNADRKGRERILHMEKVRHTEASAKGSVYISVDGVGVKHQKEVRQAGKEKDGRYVENTVVHIKADEGQYTLTATGMNNAFKVLVAFLLANRLMENRRLIFLTDGAKDIRACIQTFFSFREYTVILDWLHLKKKCKELMSMATKGTGKDRKDRADNKKQILRGLLRILWEGNVPEAIGYLNEIAPENISNPGILKQVVEYLERKSGHIACYAFRQKMGLRISSNRVEKANDLLVAKRQKHDGMSWSEKGSGALAIIAAANVNGKLHSWFRGEREWLKLPEAA